MSTIVSLLVVTFIIQAQGGSKCGIRLRLTVKLGVVMVLAFGNFHPRSCAREKSIGSSVRKNKENIYVCYLCAGFMAVQACGLRR